MALFQPFTDLEYTAPLVLLAEDEILIALDLASRIEGMGLRVMGPVASVEQGMRLLDQELPDFAILDVNLKDGLVTPLAVRLQDLNVPIVLSTANSCRALPEVLAPIVNMGKPASDQQLQAVVHALSGQERE